MAYGSIGPHGASAASRVLDRTLGAIFLHSVYRNVAMPRRFAL